MILSIRMKTEKINNKTKWPILGWSYDGCIINQEKWRNLITKKRHIFQSAGSIYPNCNSLSPSLPHLFLSALETMLVKNLIFGLCILELTYLRLSPGLSKTHMYKFINWYFIIKERYIIN